MPIGRGQFTPPRIPKFPKPPRTLRSLGVRALRAPLRAQLELLAVRRLPRHRLNRAHAYKAQVDKNIVAGADTDADVSAGRPKTPGDSLEKPILFVPNSGPERDTPRGTEWVGSDGVGCAEDERKEPDMAIRATTQAVSTPRGKRRVIGLLRIEFYDLGKTSIPLEGPIISAG